MFLPLGDEPNPRGIPWVTYGLIAVNAVVYFLISLPLSLGRPDAGNPLLLEYVQVLLETLPQDRLIASDVLQQLSAYFSESNGHHGHIFRIRLAPKAYY